MNDYTRIDVVSATGVDKFLKQGWEIVETTKSASPEGDTTLNYHVGLPARVVMNKLLTIVKVYEKHDLKNKLFEAVANENGEKLDDYEVGLYSSGTNLAKFMESYEHIVNNEYVKYSKKNASDNPDDFPF